jgi:serine protease
MAAPHVSATAALVIASGVIGPNPTPEQVEQRLEQTAAPMGTSSPNRQFGYGLVNASAATAPPPPPTPPPAPAP